MHIILGSQSPRRRELMTGLDIPFTAVSIDADESYPAQLQAGDIPLYISRAKTRAYESHLTADDILITADTIVWLENRMLGKPHCEEEAKQMLRDLSGKTHQVYTGVTFLWKVEQVPTVQEVPSVQMHSFVDKTDVTFKELTEQEIDYYVSHYHPLDKAGAYGVQEYIGYIGVTHLNGSYFNVMGFPIDKVADFLSKSLHISHNY